MIDYDSIFDNIEKDGKTHEQKTVKSVHVPETCTKNKEISTQYNFASTANINMYVKNIVENSGIASYDIQDLITKSNNLTIKSNEDANECIAIAMKARKIKNSIEAERKELTNPYLKIQKEIKRYADGYSKDLIEIENKLLSKAESFKREEKRKLQLLIKQKEEEEAKRAKEEAEKAKKEGKTNVKPKNIQPIIPIVLSNDVKTKHGTCKAVLQWNFEIEDQSKIPLEFMIVDESKIKRAVQSGARTIAGVRIYEEEKIQYRVK